MAGAGYKLFVTGEVLTAAQVNTYLQEQTVMSFADSAARTTALSGVLAEGMMSYLRDTNAVQVYNGSAWVAVGGSSPLTTKGDLYGFNTADARIPVGANDTVLTADSTQSLGLKWAAAPSPSYTWTAFTPVIKQGTTTFTVDANSAKSITIGKFVTVYFYTTIATGTGQSNTEIRVYVPTTKQIANFNLGQVNGVMAVFDSSASYAFYAGNFSAYQPDYGFIVSGINKATEEWGKTGSDFAIQLAAGDVIMGTISYEIA